jgi:hypothetical protein
METMREYAVRRAGEVKSYRQTAIDAGLGEGAYEWLCKFARDEIPNPGSDRVEKLYKYYKLLEMKKRRVA